MGLWITIWLYFVVRILGSCPTQSWCNISSSPGNPLHLLRVFILANRATSCTPCLRNEVAKYAPAKERNVMMDLAFLVSPKMINHKYFLSLGISFMQFHGKVRNDLDIEMVFKITNISCLAGFHGYILSYLIIAYINFMHQPFTCSYIWKHNIYDDFQTLRRHRLLKRLTYSNTWTNYIWYPDAMAAETTEMPPWRGVGGGISIVCAVAAPGNHH